jgi:signal transduction histidine kinase
VQTDLVSIGLRIRAAVASGSEVLVADVDDALADLERVRAEEIRGASRQLSPNLEYVTLDAALRDLAKAYRPGMVITIHVSDAAARELAHQDQKSCSIGLYRICEQGLLNAAVHGHATECSVHISLSARNNLELEVRDNGVGLPAGAITPGMGSTVISAWAEGLGGEWSLTPANVGVTLMASFSCA